MARPRVNVDILEIIGLRWAGLGWRDIARQTSLGKGTVVSYHRRAIELLALSQNPFANPIESTLGGNLVSDQGLREESRLTKCDG
jgi:hypothetical protein